MLFTIYTVLDSLAPEMKTTAEWITLQLVRYFIECYYFIQHVLFFLHYIYLKVFIYYGLFSLLINLPISFLI